MSERLRFDIGDSPLQQRIAVRYRHVDIFDREAAIDDYIQAFMPELSKERLSAVRDRVRDECRQ